MFLGCILVLLTPPRYRIEKYAASAKRVQIHRNRA
jgi:hypothetical protein